MDFFQNQDAARRTTRVMVVLYLLAVAGVIVAIDLVLAIVWLLGSDVRLPLGTGPLALLQAVPREIYALGAAATAFVIFVVSIVQIVKLASGGVEVARLVGARLVTANTRDPLERRLLNVVEEMAIASGVRIPLVFVMDEEPGINAFAAGYDVSNAIVTVTRGTLETLSRDELQGVIGHEFSHILNGDMWLNIKMIGVLAGIVFIGSIGGALMRGSRKAEDARGALAAFTLGFALLIVGSVGTLFARLIKAAVSRQREYLADASSVQFTRNPDGIAGALDQIRASSHGALVANRYAEEMSHMFFGQGIDVWMAALFATHPPIEDRIARVRPGFQATRYRQNRSAGDAPGPAAVQGGTMTGFAGSTPDGQRASDTGNAWGRSAADSAKLVGTLDARKVDYATRLLSRLAPELRDAMKEADGACAVLVAGLLAPKEEVRAAQIEALRAVRLEALGERAATLSAYLEGLGRGFDLLVIDLCLPAIKASAVEQQRKLVAALEAVINADRRVSLHEFVVLTLIRTQLAPRAKPGAVKTRPLPALQDEIVVALSLVALAGRKPGRDPAFDAEAAAAFDAGAKAAGLAGVKMLAGDQLSLDSASRALENLMLAAPLAKAILVKALFAVVTADGTIRLMEAELMRLIGAVLECPLPPLMEDVDPATLAA